MLTRSRARRAIFGAAVAALWIFLVLGVLPARHAAAASPVAAAADACLRAARPAVAPRRSHAPALHALPLSLRRALARVRQAPHRLGDPWAIDFLAAAPSTVRDPLTGVARAPARARRQALAPESSRPRASRAPPRSGSRGT